MLILILKTYNKYNLWYLFKYLEDPNVIETCEVNKKNRVVSNRKWTYIKTDEA